MKQCPAHSPFGDNINVQPLNMASPSSSSVDIEVRWSNHKDIKAWLVLVPTSGNFVANFVCRNGSKGTLK